MPLITTRNLLHIVRQNYYRNHHEVTLTSTSNPVNKFTLEGLCWNPKLHVISTK